MLLQRESRYMVTIDDNDNVERTVSCKYKEWNILMKLRSMLSNERFLLCML